MALVNENQAERLAQSFVGYEAHLERFAEEPVGLYGFDPVLEYLFAVYRPDAMRVGGTEVVAVSKVTGIVRIAERVGE